VPKLPREIEADPARAAIEAALARAARPLWAGGSLAVARVPLDPALEAALVAAMNAHRLERGLERVEQVLHAEQRGLDALQVRQGGPPVDRASRLLVVADDGTERFYRDVEKLLLRHADRLLGIGVEAPSSRLAKAVFGRDILVKAALVSDRSATSAVLRALGQ